MQSYEEQVPGLHRSRQPGDPGPRAPHHQREDHSLSFQTESGPGDPPSPWMSLLSPAVTIQPGAFLLDFVLCHLIDQSPPLSAGLVALAVGGRVSSGHGSINHGSSAGRAARAPFPGDTWPSLEGHRAEKHSAWNRPG